MNVSKHEERIVCVFQGERERESKEEVFSNSVKAERRDITKVFQECKVLRGALLLFYFFLQHKEERERSRLSHHYYYALCCGLCFCSLISIDIVSYNNERVSHLIIIFNDSAITMNDFVCYFSARLCYAFRKMCNVYILSSLLQSSRNDNLSLYGNFHALSPLPRYRILCWVWLSMKYTTTKREEIYIDNTIYIWAHIWIA